MAIAAMQRMMPRCRRHLQRRAIIIEPAERTDCTVVFLHGQNDQASTFTPMFGLLGGLVGAWRIVVPDGLVEEEGDRYGGRSWWTTPSQVEASISFVRALVDEQHGLHPGRPVFVGGYDQGASLALRVGLLRTATPLAGVIALSATEIPDTSTSSCDVLAYHGDRDLVVSSEAARSSYDRLIRSGHKVDLRILRDVGHAIVHEQFVQMADWIADRNEGATIDQVKRGFSVP